MSRRRRKILILTISDVFASHDSSRLRSWKAACCGTAARMTRSVDNDWPNSESNVATDSYR